MATLGRPLVGSADRMKDGMRKKKNSEKPALTIEKLAQLEALQGDDGLALQVN